MMPVEEPSTASERKSLASFVEADADLAIELRDYHRAMVDRRIREAEFEA
jgi:hypothetical protein